MSREDDDDVFLMEVRYELNRAREKFPANVHLLAALTEEVGEVARALLDGPDGATSLRAECVQVACLALRIAVEGEGAFKERPWLARKSPSSPLDENKRTMQKLIAAHERAARECKAGAQGACVGADDLAEMAEEYSKIAAGLRIWLNALALGDG